MGGGKVGVGQGKGGFFFWAGGAANDANIRRTFNVCARSQDHSTHCLAFSLSPRCYHHFLLLSLSLLPSLFLFSHTYVRMKVKADNVRCSSIALHKRRKTVCYTFWWPPIHLSVCVCARVWVCVCYFWPWKTLRKMGRGKRTAVEGRQGYARHATQKP